MRRKLIFIAGVGVGYVLGTRAGRERFDQMVAQAHKMWESPTVQEAAGVVQAQASRLYDEGKHAVVAKVRSLSGRTDRTQFDPDTYEPLPASEVSAGAESGMGFDASANQRHHPASAI